MDWDDLRHFGALAATGSLSAAARALGVEHATVGRRVAALEASLGVALVDRRGRRWRLTAEGQRIATIAGQMEASAQAARRAAEGTRSGLAGTVTVSAPPALAAAWLTAPLIALRKEHPALTIRIVGEARSASLDRGEADVAVRLSRPDKGAFTILKAGEIAFGLYAAPDYLTATGEADWSFVGYEVPGGPAPQQAALESYAAGRPFSFQAGSLEIQQAATAAGAGIAALPDFMAASDPRLVPLFPQQALVIRDVWLVVHSELKGSAPVRAVVQRLREAIPRRG